MSSAGGSGGGGSGGGGSGGCGSGGRGNLSSSMIPAGRLDQSLVQGPGGRLPSLRPTRDLTLGGGGAGRVGMMPSPAAASAPVPPAPMVAPSAASSAAASSASGRRTFVPNLNAKKKQDDVNGGKASPAAPSTKPKKQPQQQQSSNSKKSNRDATDGGGGRGGGKSGRGGHGGQFVQTHSIFAEGLGGAATSGRGSAAAGRRFGGGGGGGGGSFVKAEPAAAAVSSSVEIRQKASKGYFIADLKEGETPPVRVPLPLVTAASSASRRLQRPEEDDETEAALGEVKEEPMDTTSDADLAADASKLAGAATAPVAAAAAAADVLAECAYSGEFFALQLPAVIPCSTASSSATAAGGSGDVRDDVSGCGEGLEAWPDACRIGTLQVLDTGEVRLLLRSGSSDGRTENLTAAAAVPFSVGLGADIPHLQELLRLRRRRRQRSATAAGVEQDDVDMDAADEDQHQDREESAELIRLGRIDKRLVCSPDIDALLRCFDDREAADGGDPVL